MTERACSVCGAELGDSLEPAGAWCSACLELREALALLHSEGWLRVWARGHELSAEELGAIGPTDRLDLVLRPPESMTTETFREEVYGGRIYLEDLLSRRLGGPRESPTEGATEGAWYVDTLRGIAARTPIEGEP